MSPRKVGVVDADTHLTLVLAAILLLTQIPSLTCGMDDFLTSGSSRRRRYPRYVVTAVQAQPVIEEFAKTGSWFTVADEPTVAGSTNKNGEAQECETAEPLVIRCSEETQRLERAMEAITFTRTGTRFLRVWR
jgi:hypothetical protein